ncbi:DUF4347 domain-containing protein [Corallococcus terminator]
METHLTVISYTRLLESLFEDIDDVVKLKGCPPQDGIEARGSLSSTYALIERCQKWQNLPNIALNVGRPIDLLDLVGHGSSELFELGDEPFMMSHVEPPEVIAVLKRVRPYLAENARVRLLGCETAVGKSGLRMLKSVSRALEREVFGTTVELFSTDFGPQGLDEDFASSWLYSSKNDTPTEGTSREASSLSKSKEAHPWEQRLPGYRVIGRGEPFSAAGLSLRVQGRDVTFASDRRLALVKDLREEAPLILRWSKPEPAPPLEKLLPLLR